MTSKTIKPARRPAKTAGQPVAWQLSPAPRGGKMLAIRARLKLSRDHFARMLSISTRSLAMLESGHKPSDAHRRKLIEVRRMTDALGEVIAAERLGEWLLTPSDAFDGLKPLEVMERGENDRIWQMIFVLRAGVPS